MPHVLSVAFCNYLLSSFSPGQLDPEVSAAHRRLSQAASVCLLQQQEASVKWDEGAGAYNIQASLLQDMQETGFAAKAGKLRAGYSLGAPNSVNFGSSQCKCIGIDNVPGNVTASVGQNRTANFPFSVGSHCDAWDAGTHPDCMSNSPPAWCSDQWCFVDPCSCSIASTPVVSSYFPAAKFQGNGLFYSYATCGGTDSFTASNHFTACVNQKTQAACNTLATTCDWTLDQGCIGKALAGAHCSVAHRNNQNTWGNWSCPCIGISARNASLQVSSLNGASYPGEMGSTCQAWDDNNHPDCQLKNVSARPSWCANSWCYVDPCQCGLDVAPKKATYFPTAMFQGNRVYYSYATCAGSGANQGSADTYTSSNNVNACTNQKDQTACLASPTGCTWAMVSQAIGYQCLGTELATMCAAGGHGGQSGAAAAAPAALLAALLAALSPMLRAA